MAALPGFRSALALSLWLAATLPAAAADGFLKPKARADELLPVDQAFRLDGARREGGGVTLQWTVAPGYYLYGHMFKVSVDAPTAAPLAALKLPKGEVKQDAEFGEVTVHRGVLTAQLPLPAGPAPRTLRVRYQGCADVGVCYPPQTKLVAVR